MNRFRRWLRRARTIILSREAIVVVGGIICLLSFQALGHGLSRLIRASELVNLIIKLLSLLLGMYSVFALHEVLHWRPRKSSGFPVITRDKQ